MQLYHPLQFFTILLGYAFSSSTLKYLLPILSFDWQLTIILLLVVLTVSGWFYWFIINNQAFNCKVCLLAIILGLLIGTYL